MYDIINLIEKRLAGGNRGARRAVCYGILRRAGQIKSDLTGGVYFPSYCSAHKCGIMIGEDYSLLWAGKGLLRE